MTTATFENPQEVKLGNPQEAKLASAVIRGVNLITDDRITPDAQVVKDPDGTQSALQLATNKVMIFNGDPTKRPSWASLQVGVNNSIRFHLGHSESMVSLGAPGEFNVDAVNKERGRFTVRNDGKVGINQPDPTATLDVEGTIKAKSLSFTGELSVPGMKPESQSPDPKRLQMVFFDAVTGTLYFHD